MLIKELISIPESVRKGDFVLRLTEGVDKDHADRTIADYEVTPQLAKCFGEALALIKASIDGKSSKGTYLHGSFGSGKSHFMAVLHLLLQGNIKARSIPELGSAIAANTSWLHTPTGAGKKCLLIPFNLLGAQSLEQALFGRYVEYISKLHPEAPLPGVFIGEKVFQDADRLRGLMGDAKFFETLSAGASGGAGGWGKRGAGWTAETYEAAKAAGPRSQERSRLIGTLVEKLLPSLREAAQTAQGGESYINVDDGLSVLSKHAQSLGYDTLVLFLDELILWLAANAADPSFVAREIQKLIKVVEPQNADRPVPIVSFIARQRDLRELVGTNLAGSQQLAFSDTLKFWEGRFGTITLEDRNLPAIAKKRVLKPKDDAAKGQIDVAFEQTKRIRDDLRNVLLTSKSDEQAFRDVYPFSPALVETLVAVSSFLQRERTALKVMVQLLVDQRETLQLGQLVPVGDLYDLISQGDEAVTEGMKRTFEQASRLYHQKLLPLLESKHGSIETIRDLGWDDPKRAQFRADDRIIKTLLLGALAPEVESLKGLTPRKIAALNHGSFKSAIPGNEARDIQRKLREWAGAVGEIRVGEDPQDPTVGIELTGVDTQSILDAVQTEDTPGNRQAKVRELLYKAVGIEESKGFFTEHAYVWRGSRRNFDVSYGNIRDPDSLADESFKSLEDNWKIIIDYPFDDSNHTPLDDLARLRKLQERMPPQKTLCWLPSFLTPKGQANIGLLVKLDYLLTQERLSSYTSHLSPQDRNTAKLLLDNQRSQVQSQVLSDLDAAYGVVESAKSDRIDASHDLDDHFKSLLQAFNPVPPVAANLRGGFERLLEQALAHQFPKAPQFEVEIKPAQLKKAHGELQKAMQAENGRIIVDQVLRKDVRQVVNPLRLANMTEQALVLEQHWKTHFVKKISEHGGVPTVAHMRKWIDQPDAMGLSESVQNLVILVAAEQLGRVFKHGGRLLTPSIDDLDNDYELHEQVLPTPKQWQEAQDRAAAVFGVTVPPLLSVTNVSALGKSVQEQAKAHKDACLSLASRLQTRLPAFGLEPTAANRSKTASATLALVQSIERAPIDAVVGVLAAATLATSSSAMGTSLKSAGKMVSAIDGCQWQLLDSIKQLADDRKDAAAAIWASVKQAIEADELAVGLEPALRSAMSQATALLVRPTTPPPTPPPTVVPPTPPPTVLPPRGKVRRLVGEKALADMSGSDAVRLLQGLEQELKADAALRLDISYKIIRLEDEPE
jgi:hypothetical protein